MKKINQKIYYGIIGFVIGILLTVGGIQFSLLIYNRIFKAPLPPTKLEIEHRIKLIEAQAELKVIWSKIMEQDAELFQLINPSDGPLIMVPRQSIQELNERVSELSSESLD